MSSIPIFNPEAFNEASASDARRAAGLAPRPLEGIPYLVKDNIKVKGMTVAAGSAAFEQLVATDDAACVEILRAAGAIVLGRTNMPAMANGGMQRGIYGRAESPYNLQYLTAAYASGSSNGSATATTSNFAAFALGTETVSSGRSPASNNALAAYTPSRGILPLRGVWPLYPTCDVLVPYTRTMADMIHILDVLATSNQDSSGDFWKSQPYITLPTLDTVRPQTYSSLADKNALQGKRLGVPLMYIGGYSPAPIRVRPSVVRLWERAKRSLVACGATVVELDEFPLVTTYETIESKAGNNTWANIAGVPQDWLKVERRELIAHAWNDFLTTNKQAGLDSLSLVNPELILQLEPGSLQQDTEEDSELTGQSLVDYPVNKLRSMFHLSEMERGLRALEKARKDTLHDWMDKFNLDAVVFPANGDVGRANSDIDFEESILAWANGVLYSNGNLPIRHLGVPTVSVPMGVMEDTKMPVNLTIAGRAYEDNELLKFAFAFEAATHFRVPPPLVPALDSDHIPEGIMSWPQQLRKMPNIVVTDTKKASEGFLAYIDVSGTVEHDIGDEVETVTCYVDGDLHRPIIDGSNWHIQFTSQKKEPWSCWTNPMLAQGMILIVCRLKSTAVGGKLILV